MPTHLASQESVLDSSHAYIQTSDLRPHRDDIQRSVNSADEQRRPNIDPQPV